MSKRPSKVAWFTSTRSVYQEPQVGELFKMNNISTTQIKSDDATLKTN